MTAGQVVRKPQDPGPSGSGGDGGVNVLAMLVLLLVCLLVVAPMVFRAWRKGDRWAAAVLVAAPVVCIGLWALAVVLTN